MIPEEAADSRGVRFEGIVALHQEGATFEKVADEKSEEASSA